METLLNSPEKLILRISTNTSLANAIRRTLSEVKTLAIDEVEMYHNDSALYDEMITHRLGLIPLKTEGKMSDKTKIDLKLSKIGPCTVYSSDIEGDAQVLYGQIPITLLREGQKLEFTATATLGKGLDHAKYIPGLCFYRHILKVKSSKEIDAIVEKSTFGLIKSEKKGSSWTCDLSDGEVDDIKSIDAEAVSDSDELIFIIESYGTLSAQAILDKAVEALEENLDIVEKEFK